MIKKAMILAAGFGKRILPLTLKCPKPLLKIGNETLLSNSLKFLEIPRKSMGIPLNAAGRHDLKYFPSVRIGIEDLRGGSAHGIHGTSLESMEISSDFYR